MGYTPAVLGCGTMGVAILSGVLTSLESRLATHPAQGSKSGSSNGAISAHDIEPPSGISTPTASLFLDAPEETLPSRFIATVGREETARKLKRTFVAMGRMGERVEVTAGGNVQAVQEADVILVCSKPQIAKTILLEEGMAAALEGKLVISICAGVTISQLVSWVPSSTKVVRAMPNTPCKIREGMTIVTPLPASDAHNRSLILAIFTSCGRCRFLDEKHFDACTALAGSGPAFVSLVLEAMTDGGVMMGLPRAEALELAAQTMQGTGRMALYAGLHPAQLKDSVTTPGGCTIAGLLTLEDGRVRSTMARAIQVATNHASGLGQDAKK